MTLANRVRELREKRGESLDTVADAVGLHKAHLSRLERSLVGCNDETKLRLAEHFGVGIEDIFFKKPVVSDATGAPA